jgi:SRSO17 transposase
MNRIDVEGWLEELEALHERIAPYFRRSEPRERSLAYVKGLLSGVERRNGWQLAEQAGEATPDGMQRLLATADWDEEGVREELSEYVRETLGGKDAVLVVDETGFLKKGKKSVGVKRQYSGTAGGVDNAQVGVFLAYTTSLGTAFIDRALFLPEEWVNDLERRDEARVPTEVTFKTKPQLALSMFKTAFKAGVKAAWITADSVYSSSEVRRYLENRKQPFVLGISAQFMLRFPEGDGLRQARVAALFAELKAKSWQRLSAGQGSKGERFFEWAWVSLSDLSKDAARSTSKSQSKGKFDKWVLARRSVQDPKEVAYYIVFAPKATPFQEVIRVAGTRWVIETGFEAVKNEAGLDEYEVRSWVAWYRHITLSLLAYAFLVTIRTRELQKGGHSSVT